MVKVCIIGFGGIAQSHRAAYENLEKMGIAKLVGVCDIRPEMFEKHLAINIDTGAASTEKNFNCYTDRNEMLKKEQPDTVDLCVPTYLHADLAVEMLERGYNVQSEKPMSLTYADCQRMLAAAKKSGKQLMIGQVLHFSPAYRFLKDAVEDGRYGKVITAFFQRLSSPPKWSFEDWFLNYDRSGGAMTDLHVHDVDMVRWLFGDPEKVSCVAKEVVCKYDSCFTNFYYPDKAVTAIGDWGLRGHEFGASFRVCFEKAVVEMDPTREIVVIPSDGGEKQYPELCKRNMMELEIEYFSKVCAGEFENTENRPEGSAETIRLIESLRKSAEANGEIIPL